ncbi:MAG: hypothetical protein KatS3mg054_0139 [Chloroflexus sp.]|nr:MAG: hypothetical protein KatS3mg054_0139 [Chloroflexus sp.]
MRIDQFAMVCSRAQDPGLILNLPEHSRFIASSLLSISKETAGLKIGKDLKLDGHLAMSLITAISDVLYSSGVIVESDGSIDPIEALTIVSKAVAKKSKPAAAMFHANMLMVLRHYDVIKLSADNDADAVHEAMNAGCRVALISLGSLLSDPQQYGLMYAGPECAAPGLFCDAGSGPGIVRFVQKTSAIWQASDSESVVWAWGMENPLKTVKVLVRKH